MSKIKRYIDDLRDRGIDPMDPDHVIDNAAWRADQLLIQGMKPIKGENLKHKCES